STMATIQERVAPAAATPPAGTANSMKWFGLAIAIALGLIIMFIPTPAGLTPVGQRVLAIIAFTVVLWVFQVINNGIAAILMMALLIPAGVRVPDALSGFSGGSWWILVSVLFYGCA